MKPGALLLLAAILAALGGAQDPAPGSTAITGVTVVDVEKGALLPDRTVLIEGERIARVAPADVLAPPADARIVDGRGLFLMPGLVDSHVHWIDQKTYGPLHVANGVTFVREMGNATATALGVRRRLAQREVLGPEMIVTGAIIDGDPPIWPFSEKCRTAEDGRAAARKLAEAGVDQLKVYSRLPRDAYFAVLDEAKKLGKKAVGHVPEAVTLQEAANAGQATVEHMIGFERVFAKLAGAEVSTSITQIFKLWKHYEKADRAALEKVLEEFRATGCAVCPTLVVVEGIAGMADKGREDPLLVYVPSPMKTFWKMGSYGAMAEGAKESLPMRQAFMRDLHRAKVPLLCGTDLANPNVIAGFSLHREMELFQEAGIPAPDVIRSATITPAKLFGVGDRLGAVAEGRTASLVLLRKDPLANVRNAAEIEGVFLRGRHFDRKELDALLEEVRTAAGGSTAPASRPGADSRPR